MIFFKDFPEILIYIGDHFKSNITLFFSLFVFFCFLFLYLFFRLYDFYDFIIYAIIMIILVIIFLLLFYKNLLLFFYFIFHGNLIILIVLAVMLVIILALIAMIMAITSGWIFNLCFRLFVDRKLTTYFFYLIIVGIFTIYILFLFDLNWIIKWTNLNTVNLII